MKKVLLLLVLMITGTIFYQSLQPADISNLESGFILEKLQALLQWLSLDGLITNHVLRKIGHFTEYFVQGFALTAFFFFTWKRSSIYIIYALFFGLLTAVVDENIQLFSPGRAGMVQDVALDFVGVLAGTFCCSLLCWLWGKLKF